MNWSIDEKIIWDLISDLICKNSGHDGQQFGRVVLEGEGGVWNWNLHSSNDIWWRLIGPDDWWSPWLNVVALVLAKDYSVCPKTKAAIAVLAFLLYLVAFFRLICSRPKTLSHCSLIRNWNKKREIQSSSTDGNYTRICVRVCMGVVAAFSRCRFNECQNGMCREKEVPFALWRYSCYHFE